MKIHADFSQKVLVHSQQSPWLASPMAGVDRRPLDRVGDEVARATSIVRYAPGSHFSAHVHTGGEEFLVLDGVFQDEHGDYPAGTYVRNPPNTRHTPSSESGCTIFVKLWQFRPNDARQFSVDTQSAEYSDDPEQAGVRWLSLYKDAIENVSMVDVAPNQMFDIDTPNGAELLLVSGTLIDNTQELTEQDWLRVPTLSQISLVAGPQGARFWLKTGYLDDVENQIQRVQKA
ncbi:cupin domain-containing protein [Aliiglaciecola sp.]|nr:cupin domain-containing protein [Aliiglaciecola sp.]